MSRIIVLSYDYPPNSGGISRLASAAVGELARRGYEVEVLTLASDAQAGLSRPAVSTVVVPRGGLGRDLATFCYLRRLAGDSPILTTVWNPEATLAWLARRRRVTILAHGNEVMPYAVGKTSGLKGRLRRHILGAAHAVVCNSGYTEKLVQRLNPNAKTVVIHPAVDASSFTRQHDTHTTRKYFGLPMDKRLVLSVSRLDAYKGHDVVLRALARLPRELRSRLHYVIAGQGPGLLVLQTMVEELGLTDDVSWLGFVEDENLPALYASVDLFALCTREDTGTCRVEGFGMVFLEAQAAGLAVLGTRAGGIPDAIKEGEGGWLVPEDDVCAVTALLQQLAESTATFIQQGILGRERVLREATWKQYVDQLLAVVYEERG